MKVRKSLALMVMTALLAAILAMPAYAAKTPVITDDYTDAEQASLYAGQDEIGIEMTTRYGRNGIRFYFTNENTDIFPQANRWIEPLTGKAYMQVSFLAGELKERQIIQAPSNPAWWPYIGVVMMNAEGALTLGVADQGETMPVPGGEAITAETWYDLTVLMDYDSQTMTAWVGEMPAEPAFVAFPVEAAEMMAVNVQLNNSGDRGVFYSFLEVGNYEDTADFAGAATAEAPAEEVTAEEAPAEEAPVEEVPAEEAPTEEAPVEEAPVEEAPAEEVPADEAPAEEVTAEAPAEEAPVEDTAAGGEEPAAEAAPELTTNPQTGDNSITIVMVCAVLLAVSILGAAFLYRSRKKINR